MRRYLMVLTVFFLSVKPIKAEENILVDKAAMKCVLDNIGKYIQSPDDPVIIFLKKCPKVTVDEETILSEAYNSLPNLEASKDNAQPTNVISFTKKELNCLSVEQDKQLLDKGQFYEIPQKICN